jgi:hypothetical protein
MLINQLDQLSQYMDYYIDKLHLNAKPFYIHYNEDWNKGHINPHAKDGWHGVSNPPKDLKVKICHSDFPILSFKDYLHVSKSFVY